jgi:hypothetical protein
MDWWRDSNHNEVAGRRLHVAGSALEFVGARCRAPALHPEQKNLRGGKEYGGEEEYQD